ncbi:MAG: hypothetical protein Q4C61_02325 [Lachnospiraceae bacterium]|nr:hypothetical protein [Lachnospiraceae bacterium]
MGGVLKEFLQKNRAEVLSVSIFEYNEELHMQQEREEAMEEGLQKGMQKGLQKGLQQGSVLMLISQIRKKLGKGFSVQEIADALEEEVPRIREICEVIDRYPKAEDTEIYDLWEAKTKDKEA